MKRKLSDRSVIKVLENDVLLLKEELAHWKRVALKNSEENHDLRKQVSFFRQILLNLTDRSSPVHQTEAKSP